MSFLRALRAYVGLGPDDEIEERYLADLNARRRALDLEAIDGAEAQPAARPRRDRVGRAPMAESRRAAGFGYGFDGPDGSDGGVFGEIVDEAEVGPGGDGFGPVERYDVEADLDTEHGLLVDDDPWAAESLVDHDGPDSPDSPDGPDSPDSTVIDLTDADDGSVIDLTADEGASDADGAFDLDDDFGVVRSLDAVRAKPRTLMPESFADAKLVADEFKRGIPVLLNLQGVERALARRLVDFASGVCYALDGSMEKVASQVFLLIPEGAEVSDEDRRRILERGYAR